MCNAGVDQMRTCPLCGGKSRGMAFPYRTKFNNIVFKYLRCSGCSSVFVDPIPDGQTVSRMYAKSNYHDCHYDGKSREAHLESVRLLSGYITPGSLVLDFGCGLGAFLKALATAGFVPYGVDFDQDAANFAGKNAGCETMTTEQFLARPDKDLFDAVYLGDVLEHLPDPAGTLRQLLTFLKSGGVLFCEGPLEIQQSLVYWAALLYGAIKRRARPRYFGENPPTHLFRTGAKQQLAFFRRVAPSLGLKEWQVYESGWPYINGGGVKRAIAKLAIWLGGRRFFGEVCGNRFRAIFVIGAVRTMQQSPPTSSE